MSNAQTSAINIRILDMMVQRLQIVNIGNLVLVVAVAVYLWNSFSKTFLVAWIAVNILISIARIVLFYRRYQRSEIGAHNVQHWLSAFCVSLCVTNFVWAAAFLAFIQSNDPTMILVLMFCFYTIVAAAMGTLSAYIPAFLCHGLPLIAAITYYLFGSGDVNRIAYGSAALIFYFVVFLLAQASNKNIRELILLRLQEKQLNQDLADKTAVAEKALVDKNRFLASASHDLRQPLHSIGLLVSSLKPHLHEENSLRIIEDTQIALNALRNSFNGILDLSKFDAGTIQTNPSHFTCAGLLGELSTEFTPLAQAKNLQLSIDCRQDIILHTDRDLLARILRNLLSNAIRYTQAGSVSLSADAGSNLATLKVSDTGIGIAADDLQNVFSEYFQISNTARDPSEGFGLGLSIVQRIADVLKLIIDVQSRPDSGTSFTLTIPLGEDGQVDSNSVKRTSVRALDKLNILLIDDDAGVRNAIEHIVQLWGCKVQTHACSADAITHINQSNIVPDILLCDYRLAAGETGLSAIEAIEDEVNQKIPSLIITGETSAEVIADLNASGVTILHKPVADTDLRRAIAKLSSSEIS